MESLFDKKEQLFDVHLILFVLILHPLWLFMRPWFFSRLHLKMDVSSLGLNLEAITSSSSAQRPRFLKSLLGPIGSSKKSRSSQKSVCAYTSLSHVMLIFFKTSKLNFADTTLPLDIDSIAVSLCQFWSTNIKLYVLLILLSWVLHKVIVLCIPCLTYRSMLSLLKMRATVAHHVATNISLNYILANLTCPVLVSESYLPTNLHSI